MSFLVQESLGSAGGMARNVRLYHILEYDPEDNLQVQHLIAHIYSSAEI